VFYISLCGSLNQDSLSLGVDLSTCSFQYEGFSTFLWDRFAFVYPGTS
jgi:hypothetical protein